MPFSHTYTSIHLYIYTPITYNLYIHAPLTYTYIHIHTHTHRSVCLFFMSFFSLPALLYMGGGTGIKEEDMDAFGMYKYTLGNMGAIDYSLPASRCTATPAYAYNETCIHYGDR
jgi:hypothetical protein